MDHSFPQFLTYVAAWFGTIGGIWALFDRAETVVRPELRERLSGWLTSKTPIQVEDWPGMFASVFDRVFGERHISWRCFRRSAIVSVLSVGIMSLVMTAVLGAEMWETFDLLGGSLKNTIVFVTFVLLFNVLPDYVSLLETRLLIRFMSTVRVLIHPLILIIDTALTTLIFGIGLWLGSLILSVGLGGSFAGPFWVRVHTIFSAIADGATFWNGKADAVMGIFLYSTFVTSVWIWLFVVSSLVVRSLSVFGLSIRRIGNIFDVKEKPIRSIGFVSMVLVTGGFVLLLLI